MVTQTTEAPQQCILPRKHDKATDEGDNRVQEANAGGEIYARPGRLRLRVVRVGPDVEVYHNQVPVQQQTYLTISEGLAPLVQRQRLPSVSSLHSGTGETSSTT